MLLVLGACGDDLIGTEESDIIGGKEVSAAMYPATGALLKGGRFRCTATLIYPGAAITAAHCLENTGFGGFSFTLSADVSRGLAGAEIVPVHVVHKHPGYDASGGNIGLGRVNDIGVVVLERPITSVPAERLDGPTRSYSPPGSDLLLAGYGLLNYWSSTGGVKRAATVQVERVGGYELETAHADPQPCRGDSGGPLFVDRPDGRRLTAVVSRSATTDTFCAQGSIATLVTPYLGWIEDASMDRDTGCAAGGHRAPSWPALLIWVPLLLVGCRRCRRAHSM